VPRYEASMTRVGHSVLQLQPNYADSKPPFNPRRTAMLGALVRLEEYGISTGQVVVKKESMLENAGCRKYSISHD
jgi:hypothetical protein